MFCFYINRLTEQKKDAILYKKVIILQKEVRKTKNLNGFCLSYFDIVILEAQNGRVNRLDLGAAWNYFGTVINGSARFVSADADLVVNAGETVFIPKGCVYRSEWSGVPCARFYSVPFVFAKQENNILFSLQKFDAEGLFEDISDMYAKKESGDLTAFSKFYSIFSEACTVLKEQKRQAPEKSIFPALKHLENHCEDDFDIPYLSSLCGMSESAFYALFKKQTGTTPISYKNRQRCIKAAELLRSTDYTVEYISEKLNFSSPMYLRKVLAAHFGKTPKEIRKEQREIL